jgi:ubiquinone/menaquinone biosynthesis C-methylase UbiE
MLGHSFKNLNVGHIVKAPPHPHTDTWAASVHNRTANFVDPTKTVHDFGVTHGMSVADVGCGSGHYVKMLAHAVGDKGHVYAIDIHKDMLTRLDSEMGRLGFKNITTIHCDAEREKGTKLKDGLLDMVLLSNILFQTDDDRGLFREMYRILRPAGRCVVIDWTDSFNGMGPHKKHVYTKGQAISRADEAGFKILSEFTPGAHHYGVILQK